MTIPAAADSIGFLTADLSRQLRRAFEQRLARHDVPLTPGQARALVYVAAHAGARQSVIADCMGVEPMTLVNFLDQLESLGYVERRPDPRDRRAKTVAPAPGAEPVLLQLAAIVEDMRRITTRGLSERQLRDLRDGLDRMRANLTEHA